MLKTLLLSTLLLLPFSSFGKTVSVDPKRTVGIIGPIYKNGFAIAHEIEKLAHSGSKEPIHIVINSPGGSVVSGSQILSAMALAQSRGIKIHCYVPVLAASMGFQVFIHCDKRYAFKYSLLLFHPMAITSESRMTSENLLYAARRLREWEKPFIADLLRVLKINAKTFMYHYRNETLWMGFEFKNLSPDFLTIVDDIKGATGLFDL